MHTEPTVILTVPLTLPLSLVNTFNAEAIRLGKSIPDMLAMMLVDSDVARELAAFEEEARARHAGMEISTYESPDEIPPLTTHLSNGTPATADADSNTPAEGNAT